MKDFVEDLIVSKDKEKSRSFSPTFFFCSGGGI